MQNPAFNNPPSDYLPAFDAVFAHAIEFAQVCTVKEVYDAALRIAKAFGFLEFANLLEDFFSDFEKKLITGFMKNSKLLVQKTWVEAADEELKEEMLYKIELLCGKLLKADSISVYGELFPKFFEAVYDAQVLLFGGLAKTGSFLEYALRIDIKFGFFCYYADCVSKIKDISDEKARAAILLAMFFLSDF